MGGFTSGGAAPNRPSNDGPSLGLDFVNYPSDALKSGLNNGERGCSCEKTCSYLGYRLITYTFIPTILNAIATIVSLILGVLTLPTRLCSPGLNDRCWNQVCISGTRLWENLLLDVTYDLRAAISFLCCCESHDERIVRNIVDYTSD